jgi:RNA polymerase sigma factor (sigma-70 family)
MSCEAETLILTGSATACIKAMSIPTRESLLSRLKDASEDSCWREFFETYWKLIYNTARKSGLSDSEAQDVVQETMVALTRHLPNFQYDRSKGSFKAWLRQLTGWKIVDLIRKRPQWDSLGGTAERDLTLDIEAEWELDWKLSIADEALRRVRERTPPKVFQVYHTNVIQGKGARETAALLRMTVPAVYMATFKVNRKLRNEVIKLENGDF